MPATQQPLWLDPLQKIESLHLYVYLCIQYQSIVLDSVPVNASNFKQVYFSYSQVLLRLDNSKKEKRKKKSVDALF